LDRHETYWKCEKTAEAAETLLKIRSEIAKTDATAEALQKFAERLRRSIYHCFKSVLLFSVAASLYMKSKQSTMAAVGSCVKGIQLATEKMVKLDVRNETIVRNHVIPLMRDILTRMEKFETGGETSKVVEIVSVLHSIGKSEKKIHDFCDAAKTFEYAVGRLDNEFSYSKTRPKIYSDLFEDLGHVFVEMHRLHEATARYRKAIEVHNYYTAQGERWF